MKVTPEDYQNFITKAKVAGGRTAEIACPECHREYDVLAPQPGDVWDTLSECPFCNKTYIKIVTHNTAKGQKIPGGLLCLDSLQG